MSRMEIGETRSVPVRARCVWNDTNLSFETDGRYRIAASGTWVDFFLKHGPAGDPSPNFYLRWFEGLRRVKNANWFALVGALDRDMESAFVIGAGCDYQATSRGQLTCFANDVKGFYWNNRGTVAVTVTRVA